MGTVGTGEEGGGGRERGEEEAAKREVVRGTVTVAGSKVPKLLWKCANEFCETLRRKLRENVHHAWKVKTPGECVLRVEAGKRCLVVVATVGAGAGASTTVVVSAKGTEEATAATAGRRGVSAWRRVCLCLEGVVVLTGVAEAVGAVAPLGKSWRGWNLWENRLSFDFFG